MLKKTIFTLGCFVFLGASGARADGPPAPGICGSGLNASSVVSLDGQELTLMIEDAQAVPNDCDYFLQNFSYIEPLRVMNVEFASPFCAVDRSGKRKGEFKWTIPMTMRGKFSLEVVVNSKHLGSVSVDGPKSEFIPNTSCN